MKKKINLGIKKKKPKLTKLPLPPKEKKEIKKPILIEPKKRILSDLSGYKALDRYFEDDKEIWL